jgi:hypothetical protein
MIRFVHLAGTYNGTENDVYSIRDNGEHVAYFIGAEKYARALETAVMIVQRTPMALGEK